MIPDFTNESAKDLVQQWYSAPKSKKNTGQQDKLYQDTEKLVNFLKDSNTQVQGKADKIAEVCQTLLQEFDKHGVGENELLAQWIARNTSRDSKFGNVGAYNSLHKLFHVIAEVNNALDIFDPFIIPSSSSVEMASIAYIDAASCSYIESESQVNIAEIAWKLHYNDPNPAYQQLNSHAKNGVKPFFTLILNDSELNIAFFGSHKFCDEENNVYLENKHILNSPEIAKVFHDFLITKIGNRDLSFESAINILANFGDLDGLKFLLTKINDHEVINEKKLNVFNILNNEPDFIKTLLDHFPSSQFKECFSQAQERGEIDIQTLFVSKDYPLTDREQECYESQTAWFKSLAEDYIPALKLYNFDKAVNDEHQNWYLKNLKGQEFYQNETNKSVKFALWMMNEMKSSDDNLDQFEILLTAIGHRRQLVAKLCQSQNAIEFGRIRTHPHKIMIGQYGEYYEAKAEKLYSQEKKTITIDIKEGKFELVKLGKMSTFHNYPFWVPKDPVFTHVANLFKEIVKMENVIAEELLEKIATFHWLIANIMPFDRGTASIAEVLTDALWLMHGFIPKTMEKGKTIDLEAILSPEIQDFKEIYPKGVHYLSKGNS